jgi:1-deoxy-D-xylulose-5-phosphate synthase
VIVHTITRKGNGYLPAMNDDADQFHAVGVIDPDTGSPVSAGSPQWTSIFAEEMVKIARERSDVVGITAAMLIPVGLHRFAEEYPERVFDVGIAEQHAVTSAAGMAFAGLHPVVAVYATFLNRALDQVLMDVALHRAGVTFVLDRAGVTGPDGASHHGMWDLALLQAVPGIRIAAPRDAVTLAEELREAVAVDDGPTVVRFAKDAVPEPMPAIERIGDVDVLRRAPGADVLVVSVGTLATTALEVSDRLADQGVPSTVVDPRWVVPVADELVELAARHRLVVTIEDGLRAGGVGAQLAQRLRDASVATPVHQVGIPTEFLEHASRAQVLSRIGLTGQDIARAVIERISSLDEPTLLPH